MVNDAAESMAAAFATVTPIGEPVVCDDWCHAIRDEMKDLPAEEAWVGLPAGVIVDTTPAADNQDADVVIRTNPATTPDWTTDDQTISDNMDQDNSVANNPLFTETLARERRASMPASRCRRISAHE